MARHLEEVCRWRDAVNLVGRLSEEDLVRHALESALGTRLLDADDEIVDIGSGAGFPGIPLAALGHSVTLLEPRERRAAFLRHALRAIGGLNARVLAGRVEDLSQPPFAAACVRAVGELGMAIGRADFLREDGKLLVWTANVKLCEGELSSPFRLDGVLPVPGSRSRAIARFRKRSTWNTGPRTGA
jgi:16S rRNA (guanine(527)-N(7))-methyltransferase RsmG